MKPLDTPLLRPHQMSEHQEEIRLTKEKLSNPAIQDKGAVQRQLRNLSLQYERQAPEALPAGEKDTAAKREAALREEITQGMLSQEEMRKNPPGAVDHHIRWERANKAKIMQWKNLRLQLAADTSNPDTWDRDVANLERYRPAGARERVRLDAQIPGKMAFTGVDEQKWETAFGSTHPDNSALNQVKRRQLTDEQRAAAAARLAKARAAKRAKALAAAEARADDSSLTPASV